jgi:hypothetical protein
MKKFLAKSIINRFRMKKKLQFRTMQPDINFLEDLVNNPDSEEFFIQNKEIYLNSEHRLGYKNGSLKKR